MAVVCADAEGAPLSRGHGLDALVLRYDDRRAQIEEKLSQVDIEHSAVEDLF
jgi:hypothetical protein